MAKKFYKNEKEQIKDYYDSVSPTFEIFDETSYNPAGINEDKLKLKTPAIKVLNIKMKTNSSIIVNWGDSHIGSPESEYKSRTKKLDFIVDYVSNYKEYTINIMNNNDHQNSGQIRQDRGSFHQDMSVEDMNKTAGIIVDKIMDYIRGNVRANHEKWFDELVGTNPTLWYNLSEFIYSSGSLLINFQYENGSSYRTLVVHKFNKNSVKLAKQIGVDVLLVAHTHKPRVLRYTYRKKNTLTNKYELKSLIVNVAASSVITAEYAIEESMRPVNTVNLNLESYADKNGKVKYAYINENALMARALLLKPRQTKRVEDKIKEITKKIENEVESMKDLPLQQKIEKAKILKMDLLVEYNNLVNQHEKALKREKEQVKANKEQDNTSNKTKTKTKKPSAKEKEEDQGKTLNPIMPQGKK